jgi:hypothetical protein
MTRCTVGVLLCVVAVLVPVLVLASPSGLNNIPTADTCTPGVLVLQAYSNSQSDAKTSLTAGAKYGAAKGLEVGVDYGFAPEGATGPVVFQVKKAWWNENGDTGGAIGLAGISSSWSEHHPYPYGVISHKFTDVDRGHFGVAPQQDANQWFVGYDHTFPSPSSVMLRADMVQDTDNESTMYSLGALVPTKFGAVEGWVTRVNADGDDSTSVTLKLDYAFTP